MATASLSVLSGPVLFCLHAADFLAWSAAGYTLEGPNMGILVWNLRRSELCTDAATVLFPPMTLAWHHDAVVLLCRRKLPRMRRVWCKMTGKSSLACGEAQYLLIGLTHPHHLPAMQTTRYRTLTAAQPGTMPGPLPP